MSEAKCSDNLLKCFGQECSTLVAGDYLVRLTKDACGKCDIKLVPYTTPVTTPNPPTSGYVTDSNGGAYDCGNPILGWTASTTSGVTYTIREGATIIASGISGTTYTVTGASVGSHTYTIEAVNSGGASANISIAVAVVACLTAPNSVTGLSTTDSGGGAYDCGNPILTWTASSGATSYDIFEGATLLGNTAGTTYTVIGASVGSHTYTVVAKNGAGSAAGVNATVTVVACLTAPSNVTGTINVYDSGTATNYTCGTGFDVDFTDVATATYYQLFEGATQIGSNSATSNFVVTGQSVGSHTYTIRACNAAGCSTGTNFAITINNCGAGIATAPGVYSFGTPRSSGATHQGLPGGAYVTTGASDFGSDINSSNSNYGICFANGGFTVPTTGTYTISHEFRVAQWLPGGGGNFFSQILIGGVPGSVGNFVCSLSNGDTSRYTVTYTRTLNAGTCYVLDMGHDGGPNIGHSEVRNFTIQS